MGCLFLLAGMVFPLGYIRDFTTTKAAFQSSHIAWMEFKIARPDFARYQCCTVPDSPLQQRFSVTAETLFTGYAVLVGVVHVRIGRVYAVYRRDAVMTRFVARNVTVSVVVVHLERIVRHGCGRWRRAV